MKVGDLQRHLADLKRMLEAAGVKGPVLTDLEAISNGLQPFHQTPLKDFADFLVRAEQYRAGGEVPSKSARGGKPKEPKPASTRDKAPAPNAEALAQEVKQLYDQAATDAVTQEMIEAAMGRVGKLKKDGLLTVAAAVDLKMQKGATMPKIVAAIRQRLVDRKGSFQRAGLLDRDTDPSPAMGAVPAEPLVGTGASAS
jgi:hypothetical protein